MNNQEHLNRTHEAHATGHSIAPGSYDRKSLNPAYAEHMYGEPGSAIPGHAASGVNPKRHIPRTLQNESGSFPSDLTSQSTTHPNSRLSGSDTTGHGVSGVNHNTHSHYTHGDTIPSSHVSGVSSNSDEYGNATRIAPGSNVHHAGAPGTGGLAGSAMATAPDSFGHNNAHPQFWKPGDVPVGDKAHHTTHAGSAIPGALGPGAAAANAHTGTQHSHNSAFSRKPVPQSEPSNMARSGYDSAGVSPNDNLYRSDTASAPSENSGHSGVFGSGVSGSSGHSFTHHNHGLQHSVADSTVPGSGPNAVHPDQGTHAPAVKYHGTVADRPVELDDPSSPVNNVGNHNGAFGHGNVTHPNLQNQAAGANHPGNQTGPYGDGAASHAHFQDSTVHRGVNTGNVQDNTIHPNANNTNIHDNTIHPNTNAPNVHNTTHTTHGGLNDTGAVPHNNTHTTHGGLNETGALHHDYGNSHTLGSGYTTTTDGSIGSHPTAHDGAPPHDPTAHKVPSAAAGARFGEKVKGLAAQGHVSKITGRNTCFTLTSNRDWVNSSEEMPMLLSTQPLETRRIWPSMRLSPARVRRRSSVASWPTRPRLVLDTKRGYEYLKIAV